MAEKKTATKKVATKKVAEVAAEPAKKACAKKACAKTAEKKVAAKPAAKKVVAKNVGLYVNAETAGFRAGDVYQALAAAKGTLNIEQIAKATKVSKEEVLLGLGWLLKEGKVIGTNVDDVKLA